MTEIRVETYPFVFLNYLHMECIKEINQHGILRLTGNIAEDKIEVYMDMASSETWVRVTLIAEDNTESILFNGVLSDILVKSEGDVYEMSIELKSGSYLLDLCPHIRSFQDSAISFQQVVSSCLLNEGQFIIHQNKEREIGQFLMQYQETDWNFFKRLANLFETFVLPEFVVSGKKIHFGYRQTENININADSFMINNSSKGIVCIVQSRELYGIGEKVLFAGRVYIIGKVHSRLLGGELCHEYFLMSREYLIDEVYYNEKVRGTSLKANVTEVENDKVKVTIQQDENKEGGGNRWFTYATVYSTPDGAGWYCMPETGDEVRLTFPDVQETSAYVASSVHLNSLAGRTNPQEKSWKNKQNKEILMTPNTMIIRNNDGLSLELNDKEGIKLISDKAITIQSGGNVNINSQNGGIAISASEQIRLKQGSATVNIADDISIAGGKIYMN